MDVRSSSSHQYFPTPSYSQYASQAVPSSLFSVEAPSHDPGHRLHPHHSRAVSHSSPPDLLATSAMHAPHEEDVQDQLLLSTPADLLSTSASALSQADDQPDGLSRPLTLQEQERLANLERLKFFLATAPSAWSGSTTASDLQDSDMSGHPNAAHPALNRFLLPNQEYVTCVLWNGLYHITGTDIVRALVFRFEAFGRPVKNMKKFEEGVFSDLRNLKPGVDACLEEPKSPFLDLLFKYQCIRTQKKQKVFFWFSVPHDRLFLDALERDLKREKMGFEPTTVVAGEPALSFTYDPKRSLYEQFSKAHVGDSDGDLDMDGRQTDEAPGSDTVDSGSKKVADGARQRRTREDGSSSDERSGEDGPPPAKLSRAGPNAAFLSMFSIFEGSPTYKMRRRRQPKVNRKTSEERSEAGSSAGSIGTRQSLDERQIAPSVGHKLGLSLSASDAFLAQANSGRFTATTGTSPAGSPFGLAARAQQASGSSMERTSSYMGSAAPSSALYSSPASQSISLPQARGPHRGNTYPVYEPPSVPSLTQPMRHGVAVPSHPYRMSTADSERTALSSTSISPAPGLGHKTKAFTCPLFSCGRLFKRMEHLKRHLRTHTMERPFQCTHCQKRFSRSDNLNQHMRTHTRGGTSELAMGMGGPMFVDGEADVESEDFDELDGDDSDSTLAAYVSRISAAGLGQAPREVEVDGDVPEEGLLPQPGMLANGAPQDAYFSQVAGVSDQFGRDQRPDQAFNAAESWNMQGSPGFSNMNLSSSPRRLMPKNSSHSLSSSAGQYATSYPGASLGGYSTSLSAPSHKSVFDHTSLYPGNALDLSSGPGPMRRHRSATPSVLQNNDLIPRPLTSASQSDYGTKNTAARGYHPYAMPSGSHAHNGINSTHSSPAGYNVPLDHSPLPMHAQSNVPRQGMLSRPSSRSHGPEYMDQGLDYSSLHGGNSLGFGMESHPGQQPSEYGSSYPVESQPFPSSFSSNAHFSLHPGSAPQQSLACVTDYISGNQSETQRVVM